MSTETESQPTSALSNDIIIARAGAYYRNMRYLIVVVMIAAGCWFGYDGFVGYPRENAQIAQLQKDADIARAAHNDTRVGMIEATLKEHKPHSDADLMIQRLLCFALPPLGIVFLFWMLYNSRGEIRMENDVLTVPGHPPVPISAIQEIDRSRWDRKGIVYFDYETSGKRGTIRLDDFVYQRPPIDAIYKRVDEQFEARLATPSSDAPTV